MKKEKIILSFIAVVFGLLVAGIAFYLLQNRKTNPTTNTKTISFISPSPTIAPSISLTLDKPKDEDVVNEKTITISGKTQSSAIIVIATGSSEDVITPSVNGEFSAVINLEEGENVLKITSIAPNGESISIKKTVTYSQEEF